MQAAEHRSALKGARQSVALPVLAAFGFVFLIPFLVDPVISASGIVYSCDPLMPKLRKAYSVFELTDICRTNTRLWVAFKLLLGTYLLAIIATCLWHMRFASFAIIRSMTSESVIAVFVASPIFTGLGLWGFTVSGPSIRSASRLSGYFYSMDNYFISQMFFMVTLVNFLTAMTQALLTVSFFSKPSEE